MFIEVSGQGPALVMLHGWSMNRRVWQLVKPYLETDFTLYCVDLPGHGDSDWQTGDLAFASLMPALAAELPDKAYWLGWSLGGQIALQFAHAYPQQVERLMLLAATPKFVADTRWQTAMPAATFAEFSQALNTDPAQLMQTFLLLQARGAQNARDTIRTLQDEVLQGKPAHPEALRAGLDCLAQFDGRALLTDLPVPVSVLLGERDNLVPAELAAALKMLQPTMDCQLIDGAGHAPMISHPAATAAMLKSMING